jgi:hypothetical protein
MSGNATLVRLNEKSAAWLQDQADRIHDRYGRHLGRGPILEGIAGAFSEMKLEFADCASVPEVTVKVMRLMRPWAMGAVAKQGGA